QIRATVRGKSGTSTYRIPEPPALNMTLDRVLQTYLPLLVRIEGRAVSLSQDGVLIWYRGRIVENLTSAPIPSISTRAMQTIPPVRNLRSDSILIRTFGGTVTLRGVTLTCHGFPLRLETGKEYLAFVRLQSGAGTIFGNAEGLFFL
ncbi:MAG TPA: hypothetical protein VFW83_01225, partial [Bryobacteraceae bacterium]|nr:hypothetical protein [Bryobacteraceae bacterium]